MVSVPCGLVIFVSMRKAADLRSLAKASLTSEVQSACAAVAPSNRRESANAVRIWGDSSKACWTERKLAQDVADSRGNPPGNGGKPSAPPAGDSATEVGAATRCKRPDPRSRLLFSRTCFRPSDPDLPSKLNYARDFSRGTSYGRRIPDSLGGHRQIISRP